MSAAGNQGTGVTRVGRAFEIRNARHWQTGEPVSIAVTGGRIVDSAPASAEIIDAGGAVVAPGLVDIHVHLREPGQSVKETIATGTRAAAAGGFTAVCCMPNTTPVVDSSAWVEWVLTRAREAGHCHVHPIAAVTQGQLGEQLTPFIALEQAGAVALSDDGRPIMNAGVMRRALEYQSHVDLPIILHEEDLTLSAGGHMNEGFTATRLGIAGIPAAAEAVMVSRDADLAELTGGRIHYAHLSCARSFEVVRDAKRRGLRVTAEACPHHWTLTDEAVDEYDTAAKMHPPLRSAADREATIAAIKDGWVDCLATDHAPHTDEEKRRPFDAAPFGIVGLETAFALTVSFLVNPGHLSLARAIELWTDGPRRVLGLPEVKLEPGFPADLSLLDPQAEWTVDPTQFFSLGRSTPFAGWHLHGRPLATCCGGRWTHAEGRLSGLGALAVPAGAQ